MGSESALVATAADTLPNAGLLAPPWTKQKHRGRLCWRRIKQICSDLSPCSTCCRYILEGVREHINQDPSSMAHSVSPRTKDFGMCP